jgi:hypothetical protein
MQKMGSNLHSANSEEEKRQSGGLTLLEIRLIGILTGGKI